jgi:hypothetical protein
VISSGISARSKEEKRKEKKITYTIFDITNSRCLGSFCINPATKSGFDADVIMWLGTPGH